MLRDEVNNQQRWDDGNGCEERVRNRQPKGHTLHVVLRKAAPEIISEKHRAPRNGGQNVSRKFRLRDREKNHGHDKPATGEDGKVVTDIADLNAVRFTVDPPRS